MLAVFAILAVMSIPYMTAVEEPALRYVIGPLGAGFLTLGLVSFWGLALGHGRGERSLQAMLDRARSGRFPDDGEPIIATGRVRPLTEPLVAPLSGTPCVGYWYRMYYTVRGSDDGMVTVPVYWGSAARPFALESPAGPVRVMAVPLMAEGLRIHQGESAVERARVWIHTTRLEPVAMKVVGELKTVFDSARDVFTDADGESRHDWKRQDDERDPGDLILAEQVLPVDEEASVYGTWSRDRGAVVAGGVGATLPAVSLVLGPPEKLEGKAGVHSFGTYLLTAIVMTAVGLGIFWLGARGLKGF
jgi:hypothetical protein